jgi:hypothetical protein
VSITKKLPIGNSENNTHNDTPSLGIGNIVPHWWYKEIRAAGDKPDLVAITVLSELYYLHRKTSGDEFNDGYVYFERKFDFTRSQLKDAIIRLDKADLADRSFRSISVNGRIFPNELHLKINLPKLLQLKAKYVSNNLASRSNNDSGNGDSSNKEDEGIVSAYMCGNSVSTYAENSSEHISNRNISLIKNRSNASSFSKNSFKSSASNLASFYPLSQLDVTLLQKSSSRNFTATSVNEILLKLSKKHNSHLFPNKQAFMSYMTKVLHFEMRDAEKVSSINFKLRCNQNKDLILQNSYLEKVEYNRDTSKMAILRRKLSAVLDSATAYQLLKSIKSYKGRSSNKEFGSEYTILLASNVELSKLQKQLILEQAKAVYGEHIDSLKIIVESSIKVQVKSLKSTPFDKTNHPDSANSNIWHQVRSMLIVHYGDLGKNIDQNWFSKLSPEIDVEKRNITLKAPSNFIKDWIQEKYSLLLEKFFQSNNYNLLGVL